MDEISRKMANVADLPLKLDLQYFADDFDGAPNLEDTPEFRDDAREFNLKMESMTKSRESVKETVETQVENEPVKDTEKAVTPEVAAPDDKPKQDSETNKAFQEMRQKLEAAEKLRLEVEAKAKKADDLIAQQWGKSHGIYTVEQYEQRLQQEREQEENQRYEEAGLRPDEIEKIRKYDEMTSMLRNQEEARTREAHLNSWADLYKVYPELSETAKVFAEGKEPEWYNAEMKAEIARGASPTAAYRNAHFETILQNAMKGTREVAKQEALNSLNSKDHMKPNASTGGDVDHVEIDDETMRMYRALNKGKTDAQIRAWHKKNSGK